MTSSLRFDVFKDVSSDIYARLETYHALLLKWQKAVNLVGNSTLDEAWERHFADSAQLVQYISLHVKTLADLGSGAGFPGLALAIMRPDIDVHLIESDERKAQFLRTVSRETTAGCVVHNMRIEEIEEGFIPDLITARALASLKELCDYSIKWAQKNPQLELLFLKGERAETEIKEARRSYDFDLKIHNSQTSKGASILHLSNLRVCV